MAKTRDASGQTERRDVRGADNDDSILSSNRGLTEQRGNNKRDTLHSNNKDKTDGK